MADADRRSRSHLRVLPPPSEEPRAPSDAALVVAARAGESSASEALCRRYAGAVLGLSHRLLGRAAEADEVAQEAFVHVLSSLDSLAEPEALAGRLRGAVVRAAHALVRRRALMRGIGLARGAEPIEAARLVSPEATPDVRAELRAIYGSIESMPARERIALVLRFVEGMSHEEVAEHLGVSPSTARRLCGVARRRARSHAPARLSPPRELAPYVETEVDEARVTRLSDRVEARVRRLRARDAGAASHRGLRLFAVAFVAAASAAIALFFARKTEMDRRSQVVEYDNSGAMTLADGSHVRLREGGRVRLERFDRRKVEITLEAGSAEFDVIHVASRTFVVHAGRVDVVDVGTRFVVTRAERMTSVAVEEGRVEVRDPTAALPARTIAAGERWSSGAAAASAETTASGVAPSSSAPPTRARATPTAPTSHDIRRAPPR